MLLSYQKQGFFKCCKEKAMKTQGTDLMLWISIILIQKNGPHSLRGGSHSFCDLFFCGVLLVIRIPSNDIYNFSTAHGLPLSFHNHDTAQSIHVLFAVMFKYQIYDAVTGEWSIDSLSVARAFWDHENAASVCGKAYFIGGWSTETETYQITGDFNVIDIYDEANGAWSVEYLPYNLFFHSTVAVDIC